MPATVSRGGVTIGKVHVVESPHHHQMPLAMKPDASCHITTSFASHGIPESSVVHIQIESSTCDSD